MAKLGHDGAGGVIADQLEFSLQNRRVKWAWRYGCWCQHDQNTLENSGLYGHWCSVNGGDIVHTLRPKTSFKSNGINSQKRNRSEDITINSRQLLTVRIFALNKLPGVALPTWGNEWYLQKTFRDRPCQRSNGIVRPYLHVMPLVKVRISCG